MRTRPSTSGSEGTFRNSLEDTRARTRRTSSDGRASVRRSVLLRLFDGGRVFRAFLPRLFNLPSRPDQELKVHRGALFQLVNSLGDLIGTGLLASCAFLRPSSHAQCTSGLSLTLIIVRRGQTTGHRLLRLGPWTYPDAAARIRDAQDVSRVHFQLMGSASIGADISSSSQFVGPLQDDARPP